MNNQLEKFASMLEKANTIGIKKRRSKNFFEVAGYPHYENVASSILAFYFDTNEEHGLKDLWLKSLIECYQAESTNNENEYITSLNSYETVENSVTREEVTPDLKRLDIVIPTKNDFVVAIENKIYADIYNPFDSYSRWMNSQYEQYKGKLEIVLSLTPVDNTELLKGTDSLGNPYYFVNITYKELIDAVQRNIGTYISEANEKWLIYMNEFIRNIESLQEGNMEINKEWQSFLEDNNSLICEYNKKYQEDQKSKVELVKRLADKLQERINDESIPLTTKAYTYGYQSFGAHVSLVIDIEKTKDTTIVIEPYFLKPGNHTEDFQHFGIFYVSIWVRQKNSRESELSKIEKILNQEQIPFVNRVINGWGNTLEIKQFDFKNSINEKDIENYVFDLWQVLVHSITE